MMTDAGDEHPLIGNLLGTYSGTEKGKKRVLGILRAAADLFSTVGYEGMTSREVARQTGVTLSNVQHYFPSRDDLLQAMLSYVMLGYDVSYDRITKEQECSGIDKIRQVCRFLLDDTRSERTRGIFFELWSLSHRNRTAAEIKNAMYVHHIDILTRVIIEVAPNCQSPREKALLIAAQVEGMMVVAVPGQAEVPVREAVELFLVSLQDIIGTWRNDAVT